MRIEIGARTDVGRVRENNEDSFRLVSELGLFVLSDGMGGQAYGEMASQIAVDTVVAHCREAQDVPELPFAGERCSEFSEKTNRLVTAVHLANRAVHEAAQSVADRRGMGATMLAAWIDRRRLSLAHVGDSRAYLLRSGQFEQLTQDHSLVAEQVRSGVLTPEQARQSEMQSVLTRALGAEEEVEVDASEQLLLDGDRLLLCSDGLTRMLPNEQIAGVLADSADPQRATDRLVELANEAGGADNVTVVVLHYAADSDGFLGWLRRAWREIRSSVS